MSIELAIRFVTEKVFKIFPTLKNPLSFEYLFRCTESMQNSQYFSTASDLGIRFLRYRDARALGTQFMYIMTSMRTVQDLKGKDDYPIDRFAYDS